MNDFYCGACSGVIQSLVGHPLDTYKVLSQNNKLTLYINPWRGIQYPMMNSVLTCSLTFGINEKLKCYNLPNYLSGFISGACIFPLVYISDNYKINEQIGNNKKINFTYIIKNKGKVASFMRESIAFSVYFYTYDKMKKFTNNSLISGGIAGLSNWTFTYPLDVIRSRQIAKQINIIDAINIGSLWKGYVFCALRAIKVNAMGFFVYEQIKEIVSCNN